MRQPVPFGKYLLLDRISVGGMAEVFKAKSYGVEGFEKIIAIKRILPTMGEDRDFIKMFIDEAKIAGQLAHANICQIFELGRIDGSHFIAMEYIWGKDLLQIQNRLRKLKKLMSIPMACFTIAKVLEGLDYAHRKRDPLGRPLEIVHRDCSPQNVLVSYEGEVKVIDFGIAKATSRNSRTMAGVLKGKFGYMSPEQVRGLPLDRRSDIFALGTMLYECLTGERLFQGETDFSTLEKVRNVDVQPPRALNPNIPEQVERIILKALAKDVDDRYQWCSEMLADLQQFLMGQDVVFTAKSLSGWLKEIFAQEIEREKQQLEQYKRVGRDGLIAGVPAAEAKLDVVEHLGEAGVPEGDATTLGGPNFEDIEAATGASSDIGPVPEPAPVARSGPAVAPRPHPAPVAAAAAPDDDDDDGDFAEEQPTEIFGEDGPAAAPPAVARTSSQPLRVPPGPPPGRPMPSRPADGFAGGYGAPQPMDPPPEAPAQMASGTPHTTPAPQLQGQGRTVLGMQAPAGLPNYANYRPSGSTAPPQGAGMPSASLAAQSAPQGPTPVPMPPQGMPGMTPQGMAAMNPNMHGGQGPGMHGGQGPGMHGGQGPGMHGHGMGMAPTMMPGQMQGQPMQGQPMQGQPYGYPQGYPNPSGAMSSGPMARYSSPSQPPAGYNTGSAMPVEAVQRAEGKRSTLVRDIAIGVLIAALVLGGFILVKKLVLDKGDSDAGPVSKLATIHLKMTPGVSATMYVDGNRFATVGDGQDFSVQAGARTIKIVGPNGAHCDEQVDLPAGKTRTLECTMPAIGAGSADTGSAGSAMAAGSAGSAGSTATSAGSAAASAGSAAASAGSASSGSGSATGTAKTNAQPAATAATTTTPEKTTPATTHTTTHAEVRHETHEAHETKSTESVAETKPADAQKGFVQLFSKPSARILVDGAATGLSTPVTGHALPLAAGHHKITFMIGNDRFTYPIVIKAGETATMNKNLE